MKVDEVRKINCQKQVQLYNYSACVGIAIFFIKKENKNLRNKFYQVGILSNSIYPSTNIPLCMFLHPQNPDLCTRFSPKMWEFDVLILRFSSSESQ